jgi:tetratricopeptide (TPR) repeat protein
VLERDRNVEALVGRANAEAYWRKDPESALADVKRILELDPDSIDALKPKILALLTLQRSDEARAAFAELGRRLEEVDAPETTRSWYCVTRAIFTGEDGDLAGARKQWPECLEQYPAILDVVFSATNFYDSHGEPERSIEVLRAAVAANGSNAAFRSRLAEVLRLSGATDEGEALLKEATNTEDASSAVMAWFELGRYRRNASNYPGAAEAMKHAYELAKNLARCRRSSASSTPRCCSGEAVRSGARGRGSAHGAGAPAPGRARTEQERERRPRSSSSPSVPALARQSTSLLLRGARCRERRRL